MKTYYVVSGNHDMYIQADEVRMVGTQIFFLKQECNVAMFNNWDYFKLVEDLN